MYENLPFFAVEGEESLFGGVSPELFSLAISDLQTSLVDVQTIIVYCAFAIIGALIALKIVGGKYV